jgi:hypothetical protein
LLAGEEYSDGANWEQRTKIKNWDCRPWVCTAQPGGEARGAHTEGVPGRSW